MSLSSTRRLNLSSALSFVLLLTLFVYFFYLPLRPTAWGGPRGAGPFEDTEPTAAGRFARVARLHLESIAKWRSPVQPLEATAEALIGYYAALSVARYAILWLIFRRLGGCGLVATLGVVASAIPVLLGAARQDELEVGLVLFVILLAATTPMRIPWSVAVGALPALFALWANAHTSAVVGLAWLGVITAGRTLEWRQARRRGSDNYPAVGRLLVASALCVLATCFNPDGPRLFVDAFKAAKNPSIGMLPAWQPVDFSKPAGMPWFYFATLAALLIAQLLSSRVFSPTALLVILSFGFWPLVQQRGQAYWWLIVPWLLVPMLSAASRHAGKILPRMTAKDVQATGAMRTGRIGIPPPRLAIIAVIIAVLVTPGARWLITGSPRNLDAIVSADTPWRVARELTSDGADEGRYLSELREAVRATYPNGRYRGAILCGEAQGDFLAWVLDGDNDKPVMLYTRPETIDREHWGEARQAKP